jgi:hypothetical protein
MAGMGLGGGYAAGAGADMLQEVLREKFSRAARADDLRLRQEQFEEQRRMRELAQQQAAENSTFLNDQRAATAEKLRADAVAKAGHEQQVNQFLSDPSLSPAVRQWGRGAALGFNQLSVHDYESPEAHQSHLTADAQRKSDESFNLHQRERDYDNSHPAPIRVRDLKFDDPSLPLGSQRYLAEIARKHPNDLAGATAELSAYVNDPQTQAAHPRLSPVKAIEALHRLVGARSGNTGDDLDALVMEATNNLGGAQPASSGRSGGPAPVRIVNGRLVGARIGSGSTATSATPSIAGDAQLSERAARVLQQQGFATSPENLTKFLSDPRNRQLLATGGQ